MQCFTPNQEAYRRLAETRYGLALDGEFGWPGESWGQGLSRKSVVKWTCNCPIVISLPDNIVQTHSLAKGSHNPELVLDSIISTYIANSGQTRESITSTR